MTWVRVDDGMTEHPKWAKLEADPRSWSECMAVWMAAACYSARVQSDGFVPWERVDRLTPLARGARKRCEQMIEAGLMERVDGGVLLHDWDDYNPTRRELDAERALKSERQKRWRQNKDASRPALNDAPVDASTRPSHDASGDSAPRARVPVPSRPLPDPQEEISSLRSEQDTSSSPVREVFDHWRQVMGKPRAKLDDKRRRLIARAVAAHDVETCKRAIDGCAASPFHMGENDRGTRFDGIELILRDAAHIERFANPGATVTPIKRDAGWRPPVSPATYAESASSEAEDDWLASQVTDEDRARIARLGGRAVHG